MVFEAKPLPLSPFLSQRGRDSTPDCCSQNTGYCPFPASSWRAFFPRAAGLQHISFHLQLPVAEAIAWEVGAFFFLPDHTWTTEALCWVWTAEITGVGAIALAWAHEVVVPCQESLAERISCCYPTLPSISDQFLE